MSEPITRREALRAMAGFAVSAAAVGCGDGKHANPVAAPACVLTPSQVQGPFFFDTGLLRRDITEGRPGVALRIQLRLASVSEVSCEPLRGALVEAWHADADGVYSGYDRAQGNLRDASGETFLRGYQVSDDDGVVEFSTIYPGWYPGRAIHIHLIVQPDAARRLTTQLYFPEAVNDEVLARSPYDARGPRDTTNATDLLVGPSLDDLTWEMTRSGSGYVARHAIGLAT